MSHEIRIHLRTISVVGLEFQAITASTSIATPFRKSAGRIDGLKRRIACCNRIFTRISRATISPRISEISVCAVIAIGTNCCDFVRTCTYAIQLSVEITYDKARTYTLKGLQPKFVHQTIVFFIGMSFLVFGIILIETCLRCLRANKSRNPSMVKVVINHQYDYARGTQCNHLAKAKARHNDTRSHWCCIFVALPAWQNSQNTKAATINWF